MKWLTIILSIYLLLLAGLPCDADCLDDLVRTETPADHTDDGATHEDWCSPFCHCASCIGFTIPPPIQFQYNFPGEPVRLIRLRSTYVNPATGDFHGRIWQPPRFA